nr:MAG TPA: hypothetical protein [Caudoviricetes sp.]
MVNRALNSELKPLTATLIHNRENDVTCKAQI